MENTNTDARKAAEKLLESTIKSHNSKHSQVYWFQFDKSETKLFVDMMLEFAQSNTDTLDKGGLIEKIKAFELKTNDDESLAYNMGLREAISAIESSLSEQLECKPAKCEQVEKLKGALEKISSLEPLCHLRSTSWDMLDISKEALNSLKH